MLNVTQNDLAFTFPQVDPGAQFSIDFHRTLRIPDDGKKYPLPPGIGQFPIARVDDYKDRVPAKWLEHGGLIIPMFQSEALWVYFHGKTAPGRGIWPMAVKVSAGLQSAVTGEPRRDGLYAGDYVVVPGQPWLDGFCVGNGVIRQFVAAPLGMGFTVEEQLTGKAEHGGMQIEVFPMKKEIFNTRFPEYRPSGSILRGGGVRSMSAQSFEACATKSMSADMGLAAGGQMDQQIFADPYTLSDWDTENPTRVFIHIVNSLVWKTITGQDPPHPPVSASQYTKSGLPWFDHYRDDLKSMDASGKLSGIKSIMELGFQKGFNILPENQSADIKPENVVPLTPIRTPDKGIVRDGKW